MSKKDNRQTIVHKTQPEKLKTDQHEPYHQLGLVSCTLDC